MPLVTAPPNDHDPEMARLPHCFNPIPGFATRRAARRGAAWLGQATGKPGASR